MEEGRDVGTAVGVDVGEVVGTPVGSPDGNDVGTWVGPIVGGLEGGDVGVDVGSAVGTDEALPSGHFGGETRDTPLLRRRCRRAAIGLLRGPTHASTRAFRCAPPRLLTNP